MTVLPHWDAPSAIILMQVLKRCLIGCQVGRGGGDMAKVKEQRAEAKVQDRR